MTSKEDWRKAEELFDEVLQMEPQSRENFIEESGCNASVRNLLAKMMQCADDNHDPIQDAIREAVSRLDDSDTTLGQKIGSYRLVKVLGQGGMGTVYLGERDDDDFRHQVAIKLIRHGYVNDGTESLFRNERQILAELHQPFICRLLDSGRLANGQIFIIMDYVDGMPIDGYCQLHDLPIRARLQLFLKICSTVQDLHQKLIVHCDLKPNNILVQANGDPKILDFGIAQTIDPRARSQRHAPGFTGYTRDFSSPEQIRGETMDVRTDVYSLGAILHRILLPAGADPKGIHPQLLGIISKATQINAKDRYPTVRALIDDIERFLKFRPIHGMPSPLSYRMGCWLARNYVYAGAAALVLAVLCGWVWREYQLRLKIEHTAQTNQAVADFLSEIFADADPYAFQDKIPTAVDILDKAVLRLEKSQNIDAAIKSQLIIRLAVSYRDLGKFDRAEALFQSLLQNGQTMELAQVYGELGEIARQRYQVPRAQAMFTKSEGLWGQSTSLERVKFQHYYSRFLLDNGEATRAEALNNEVLKACEKFPDVKETICLQAEHYRARIVGMITGTDAAAAQFERALRLQKNQLGDTSLLYLETLSGYIGMLRKNNRFEGLEARMKENIRLVERIHPPGHNFRNRVLNVLANYLHDRARYAESIATYERAFQETSSSDQNESFHYAAMLGNLGMLYIELENYGEARKLFEKALVLKRKSNPDESPHVSYAYYQLGHIALLQDRLGEADAHLNRALETRKKFPDQENMANIHEALALLAARKNQMPEAMEHMKKVWELMGDNFLEHDMREAQYLATEAQLQTGHHNDQALSRIHKALAITEKARSREHPLYAKYLLLRAGITLDRQDLARATDILKRHLHPDTPSLIKANQLARGMASR